MKARHSSVARAGTPSVSTVNTDRVRPDERATDSRSLTHSATHRLTARHRRLSPMTSSRRARHRPHPGSVPGLRNESRKCAAPHAPDAALCCPCRHKRAAQKLQRHAQTRVLCNCFAVLPSSNASVRFSLPIKPTHGPRLSGFIGFPLSRRMSRILLLAFALPIGAQKVCHIRLARIPGRRHVHPLTAHAAGCAGPLCADGAIQG